MSFAIIKSYSLICNDSFVSYVCASLISASCDIIKFVFKPGMRQPFTSGFVKLLLSATSVGVCVCVSTPEHNHVSEACMTS